MKYNCQQTLSASFAPPLPLAAQKPRSWLRCRPYWILDGAVLSLVHLIKLVNYIQEIKVAKISVQHLPRSLQVLLVLEKSQEMCEKRRRNGEQRCAMAGTHTQKHGLLRETRLLDFGVREIKFFWHLLFCFFWAIDRTLYNSR